MRKILFLLVILLSIPTVFAGCFLHTDSLSYCQEISLTQAERECSFYDDCSVSTHYSESSCASHRVCEEIFCASTCSYLARGQCVGGAFQGDIAECSAGCCSYSSLGEDFCGETRNSWECSALASSDEASSYSFAAGTTGEGCAQACSAGNIIGENYLVEELSQLTFQETSLEFDTSNSESLPASSVGSSYRLGVRILGSLVLVLVLFALVILFHHVHFRLPSKASEPLAQSHVPGESSRASFFDSSSDREESKKLYEHQKKERARERELLDAGFSSQKHFKKNSSSLHKLKRLTIAHNGPKKKPSRASEDALAKLRKISRKK